MRNSSLLLETMVLGIVAKAPRNPNENLNNNLKQSFSEYAPVGY